MSRIGKNVLTQYLRTGCDKQLFLSLFTPDELRASDLPLPLEARPQVLILREQGKAWEQAKFEDLAVAFPSAISGQQDVNERYSKVQLLDRLTPELSSPTFVIQGEFSITKEELLSEFGMSEAQIAQVPPLRAFIPDIVLVRGRQPVDEEVLPSGERIRLTADDNRQALQISDIKHAGEANSSYSSEVVLYAVSLSKWLRMNGLADRYFVTTRVSLWTRAQDISTLSALVTSNPASGPEERLAAYEADLDHVRFSVFVQSIRKFFAIDLLRVLNTPFGELEWHVDNRCSGCDYLGYREWLSSTDRVIFDENPNNYCVPLALEADHLSRISTLTRGGRRTLEGATCNSTANVAARTSDDQLFDGHNGLRADRQNLPMRAQALAEGAVSLNDQASTGDIPKWADLEVFISVNFDPGTGLLAAVGYSGYYRQRVPFGSNPDVSQDWRPAVNLILQPTFGEEQAAVLSLLSGLGQMFEFSQQNEVNDDRGRRQYTRTQLYFWDQRQFEELTKAIGRHLSAILSNANDATIIGLAWLFPPEPLLEDSEIVIANPITVLKSVVKKSLRLPTPHAITLFNVAESYFPDGREPVRRPTPFMCDPLSDMIPRERIYEIWANQPLIQIGRVIRSRSQCITDYTQVVDRQVRAIRQIAWKLRTDLSNNLRAEARHLDLRAPFGFLGLSDDSRLWLGWAKLEDSASRIDTRRLYCTDPVELEAEYKIIRFNRVIDQTGNRLTLEVAEGSLDCKFRDQQTFLCLQVDSIPGFAELRVMDLVPFAQRGGIPGGYDAPRLTMSRVFQAKLLQFDRENRTATIEFNDWPDDQLRTFLVGNGYVDLAQPLSLAEASGPPEVKKIEKCLRAIGYPPIATPHPDTVSALGRRRAQTGRGAITRPAEVLWTADTLASAASSLTEEDISTALAELSEGEVDLNPSQRDAVIRSLANRLSIIWGPPGTGKTTTGAALVAARILVAASRGEACRILLTGPTYTAWETLLADFLNVARRLPDIPVTVARLYSEFHTDRGDMPEGLPTSVVISDCVTTADDDNFAALRDSLEERQGIVVVGTVANQCFRLGKFFDENIITELFDFVVIDEASQLDLCRSLYPLCLLATDFQVAVLGDEMQMPPITRTEPPSEAGWLVGSIQSYLRRRFSIEQVPLLTNYRSAEDFVEFGRALGYDSSLRAHSPALRLLPLSGEAPEGYVSEILSPERRLVSVLYADGRCGQANPFEADMCCAIAVELFGNFSRHLAGQLDRNGNEMPDIAEPFDPETFWTHGLGIVTPHRAQRALIVRRLRQVFPDHPLELIDQAVDTVERFQGGQRQTIIVSFGVGDPDLIAQEEEFLLQLERTNVAISRAQAKCIVLISEDLAFHLPQERRIIETSIAVKSFVSEMCSNAVASEVPLAGGETRAITIRSKPPNA